MAWRGVKTAEAVLQTVVEKEHGKGRSYTAQVGNRYALPASWQWTGKLMSGSTHHPYLRGWVALDVQPA